MKSINQNDGDLGKPSIDVFAGITDFGVNAALAVFSPDFLPLAMGASFLYKVIGTKYESRLSKFIQNLGDRVKEIESNEQKALALIKERKMLFYQVCETACNRELDDESLAGLGDIYILSLKGELNTIWESRLLKLSGEMTTNLIQALKHIKAYQEVILGEKKDDHQLRCNRNNVAALIYDKMNLDIVESNSTIIGSLIDLGALNRKFTGLRQPLYLGENTPEIIEIVTISDLGGLFLKALNKSTAFHDL